MTLSNEKTIWEQTAEMHGSDSVLLGKDISAQILNDPASLVKLLARYKCSAKMGCRRGAVLEVNCKTGFGAPILLTFWQSDKRVAVHFAILRIIKPNKNVFM